MIRTVAHVTSAHPRTDIRIFLKECKSLADKYSVTLLVADGGEDEKVAGIQVIGLPRFSGRMHRFLTASAAIYRTLKRRDFDVYHFHDPEMIFCAFLLARSGKNVIFDVHEDFAKQALSKTFIPTWFRTTAGRFVAAVERHIFSELTALVAATPTIGKKLELINSRTYVVNNYPILDELDVVRSSHFKSAYVVYIGAISEQRGVRQLVDSLSLTKNPVQLKLAGPIRPRSLQTSLAITPGWANVVELGVVDRESVAQLLGNAIAGIVTFLPEPNHTDSQPNKLFEYMSAGLPVIASNFPLWEEFIDRTKCGLCVDPTRPADIARAIDWMVEHCEDRETMGLNGKRAVHDKYNWDSEKFHLFDCYRATLESSPSVLDSA